jgi:hypothetical protein
VTYLSIAMSSNQRRSFRVQIPEGREKGTLLLGEREIELRILDESAGGFAVAVLGEFELLQNQDLILQTHAGKCAVRVVRIEQFSDGKLLGLVRLREISDPNECGPRVATWRDSIFAPSQATPGGGAFLPAFLGTIAVGILLVVLAVCYVACTS